MNRAIFSLLSFLFSLSVCAQGEPPKVLSFTQWRNQQVTEVENRIARLANRLVEARANKAKLSELNSLESEIRVASQGVGVVKDLTLEEYVKVYLSQLSGSEETLAEAAKIMTREEVAALLKIILSGSRTEPSQQAVTPAEFITGLAAKKNADANL